MVDQNVIIEYLRKSYFSVDGLWFMTAEKEFDFDKAMELDEKVWQILPKIQARQAKESLGITGTSLKDLREGLKIKFEAEGYSYKIETLNDKELKILIVDECPWFRLLKKLNREHLANEIAEKICRLEYQVWAGEFKQGLKFALPSRICTGDKVCLLDFSL